MRQEVDIVRADRLRDLVQEVRKKSWDETGDYVLEVLLDQKGPDALEKMTPEELIHWGYCQGAGHVIIALAKGELQAKYTGTSAQLRKELNDGLESL